MKFTLNTFGDAYQHAQDTHRAGDPSGARDIYLALLDKAPEDDRLLFQIGNTYFDQGYYGAALNFFRRSIQERPDSMAAISNMGSALHKLRRHGDAEQAYARAIALAEDHAVPEQRKQLLGDFYGNWSGLYINAGAPEKAEALATEGLLHVPEQRDCHNHLSLALLEQGRWKEAYPHQARRVNLRGWHDRNYSLSGRTRTWQGEKVGTLAIHGEQGIGDEVMFASCVNEAKERAKQVVIECERRLVPIFSRAFGVPCYPTHEHLMEEWAGRIDAKVPFGSLFSIFRPSPESCPGTPYLTARADLVEEYRRRMRPGLNVGITWRGGTDKTHGELRKAPLSLWGPILGTCARFISLQYTQGAGAEADTYGIDHWPNAIDDLERQLALIQTCDLVISVCQSVVHFAGALGKECWVLTPDKPRWCYGRSGSRMPLYSSIELFRQEDKWEPTIRMVAERLASRVASGDGNSSLRSAMPMG